MLKHTKLFTPAGGNLGRADGNDWVLPDPERVVSSKHAMIAFGDNQYYLVDNSTNGTYLNQGENPIGKGNRVPLSEGDVIGIGDYQLKVALRRPQAESDLPKGLGGADFLDSGDRTTFSAAAAAKMQSQAEAQQLDSWLEPGANSGASHSGEWGYVGTSAGSPSSDSLVSPNAEPVDPLAVFGSSGSSGSGESWDPLAGFDSGSNRASGGQWEDDDWWKDGSSQDHAPADQHAMSFTAQQPPVVEPVQAPQPQQQVQPPQQIPPQPQPQPPAPQPAEVDNPFAESFAVMQGQQVDGAPGFNVGGQPVEGFSHASQQFSPLQQTPPQQTPQQQSPLQQNPLQQPPPQQIPPHNAGLQPSPAGVSPAAAPEPPPPPPPPAASVDTGALMAALGLNLPPEHRQQLDQQVSAIVQETIARLIDLLRARSSIKNELRVQRTMIQTEANNPLKFSATAADALGVMFSGNGAFMSPQQAVADGFDDLSDHQMAVLDGMRAGYEAMLKFFSPDNIERRVSNRGGVFGSKNAKNWEGFKELYGELARDPEACYRRLFGDEFATTYEYRLSELKNQRHLKD
ncbi:MULTISPECIES: type VI secretion system-associated FHA domain protein TagH [unclassified Microbulbifer]|uniref:type VI secretion system-associated FHA domain protein TagH n=1 Tax=unclassified Microbulbifer TaxID=2619833 RepID=UPI0027E4D9FE|nr:MULTISPECIES: type VI secretion system-associated FHA domain protein TagH [unclassified Microbulbifer]